MKTHIQSFFTFLSLIPLIIMGFQPLTFFHSTPSSAASPPSIGEGTHPNPAFHGSPVMFVENAGQFEHEVRYEVLGASSQIWLTENTIWMTVLAPEKVIKSKQPSTSDFMTSPDHPKPGKGVNFKLSFVDANPAPQLKPFNRLDTHLSYFLGKDSDRWKANLPTWGGVRYQDLYPGIDLELVSQNGEFNWRIVVDDVPPASLRSSLDSLQLQVEGADKVSLDGDQLELSTPIGEYRLPLLQIVGNQELHATPRIDGSRVRAPFTSNPPIAKTSEYSSIPSQTSPYSTFVGGSQSEAAYGIAVDDQGRAYITGLTRSSDFPVTPGAFDITHVDGANEEGYDIFVAQLNPTGSSLIYATYIGGDDWDWAKRIAIDNEYNAYLTGFTWSSDFPTTPGAFSTTRNGGLYEAFVVKLNPTGSALVYSTFLGGYGDDVGQDIALDGLGNAYVTGYTNAKNFPVTPGAYDTTRNGGSWPIQDDAFVTKLNSAGSALVYSTYLGGIEDETDRGNGIAVDGAGNAFVIGTTFAHDFPTTADAYDTSYNGGQSDAFVVKFNPAGSALVYATYLGGNGYDWGDSIDLDSTGCSFLGINTKSTDFPTTLGAYQDTPGGDVDIAVLKLDHSGAELLYSTYLAGSAEDYVSQIVADGLGYAYLTGYTESTDFPTTVGAFDTSHNGILDVIGVKINSTGSDLSYATFFGGAGYDEGLGIALHGPNNAYLAGATGSPNFPVTPGAFDTSEELGDAFVLKTGVFNNLFLPIIRN